ncbi:MAG: hypothetical protein P8N65_04530 [SAR86 cluster bacterium]|jgi:hypothetical protein|nr:hypothetical protein [SAR86 cluster bacterium]MDG2093085.1 hypothetical protein [SAR86 cluster bacterium]|tara:strand:- start:2611 stop:3777 length:1167 start_codon:yes stop_codon:yes gene_type:complete
MNRYLLHNLSNNHNEVEAFHYVEDTFQSKKQFHIDDISKYISSDSEIFYFIPSSKISSIKIDATKDDTDETIRARLLSDMDDFIVNDISENEIFIHRNSKLDLAIVINKSYLISLTKKLRSTGSKIFICPEHMLSFLKDEASIFQIADRIIFSLSAGEGFSQNELNLDDYVNLLKQERKNFLPKLYINNSTLVKNFKDSEIKDISLETLHLLFIKEHSILPNLYRSGFHLDYWIKRYQINKLDLALAIAATSLLVIYPISSTFLNNSYADEYKNETISIFKKINPNIKRVVNPRRQIDEILNSYNLEQASNLSISGLDSIKRLDIPEITKLYMDINKSEAQLTLSGLGSNQYQFLINLLPQANLNLITEDVKTSNGKVSGLITIGLSD